MERILWVAIVAATGFYICGPIVDPDLWWHITVGRWILANGTVPAVDYWNLFAAGTPWRAYSWSNEVILAWVDGLFAEQGLMALKLALAFLIAAVFFYVLGKIAKDMFIGGLLGLFATAACFNHFTLRPQSLTWVFLALLLWQAVRIEREGLSRIRLLLVGLIMMFWANTHLTTALGLVVLFFWLAGSARAGASRGAGFINLVQAKTIGAALVGTFLTPYAGGEWLTFFSKSGHPLAFAAIAEFQAATIMQYATAFMVIIVFWLLVFVHLRPRTLELPKLLLGAGFFAAALAVVKFIPLAVLLLCALVAEFWAREASDRRVLGNLAEALERLRGAFNRLPRQGAAFLFICLAIVNFYQPWVQPLSFERVPRRALDFIIEQDLPHPILNDFGMGGYVMYRLSDRFGNLEQRVAIDGRTNVNPPEVWEKFTAAFRGMVNWRDYIELVGARTVFWRNESPLTSLLLLDPQWCRVFLDGLPAAGYSVFVQRSLLSERADLESDDCT